MSVGAKERREHSFRLVCSRPSLRPSVPPRSGRRFGEMRERVRPGGALPPNRPNGHTSAPATKEPVSPSFESRGRSAEWVRGGSGPEAMSADCFSRRRPRRMEEVGSASQSTLGSALLSQAPGKTGCHDERLIHLHLAFHRDLLSSRFGVPRGRVPRFTRRRGDGPTMPKEQTGNKRLAESCGETHRGL